MLKYNFFCLMFLRLSFFIVDIFLFLYIYILYFYIYFISYISYLLRVYFISSRKYNFCSVLFFSIFKGEIHFFREQKFYSLKKIIFDPSLAVAFAMRTSSD